MHSIYLLLLILTKLCQFVIFCQIDHNLIANYLNAKYVKAVTVFGCFSKRERVALTKNLMAQNYLASVLNLHRFGFEEDIKSRNEPIGVILDGDCSGLEHFLINCGHLKRFDVRHYWLVLSASHSVVEKFENVSLNIDADIHIAIRNATNDWHILDLYNPAFGLGGELNVKQIGYHNLEEGYNITNREPKYWTRRNMTGVTFHTLIGLLEPYEEPVDHYLQSETNKSMNTFNRFQYTLLHICANYYNFKLITDVTHSWGYPYPNESFDGMVGAMEKKTIQFGSSPIFIRPDRIKAVTFGRKTWSWSAGFLFRMPKSRTSIDIFLKPLSTSIWLTTGILAVVSIIILKLVTNFEKRRSRDNIDTSWSLWLIFILGALCQQGAASVPKMACGRIAAISIFLLSVLIYQFYSASIVSNLLMKPRYQINDIKSLLESSLKVGCEDMVYIRDLFAHTTDQVIKDLYYKKVYGKENTSHYFTTEYGLKLVNNGDYAFHVEAQRAYPIIEKTFSAEAVCELREIRLIRFTDLYTAYQKHSPFYNMLETCIQRLAENGLLFKEVKHWHPRKPECIKTSQSLSSFHVGLGQFYPALLVLLIGMIISFLIFLGERYFHSKQSLLNRDNNNFPFRN